MSLSNPMIWKLSQMVLPGNKSILSPENFTSTRNIPLDMKFSSPGSSKMYDNGGIGLGIVAALENSGIGINPVRWSRRFQFDVSESEEYTCVTTRDGLTKVYYNDNEFEFGHNRSDDSDHCERRLKMAMEIAEESPANTTEVLRHSPDFLTSCCLCKKKLQDKDIYMYIGDEGFCSKECRSVKIMEDTLKVQHKSRNVEVLSSPYAGGEFSSAGIFVIC